MKFKIVNTLSEVESSAINTAFLLKDDWDDWNQFSTAYSLIVFDEKGTRTSCGQVKIGQKNLKGLSRKSYFSLNRKNGYRRPNIPNTFEVLPEKFFSLGWGDDYYEELLHLSEEARIDVLTSLRDCAFDNTIFETFYSEDSMRESLLRDINKKRVIGRLNRLALGNSKLTPYNFSFESNNLNKSKSFNISFDIDPTALPPSNVQVVIGKNGVGKTHLLSSMVTALTDPQSASSSFSPNEVERDWDFSRIITISASCFDILPPSDQKAKIPHYFVGLHYSKQKADKTPAQQFVKSLKYCTMGMRKHRWLDAINHLEVDPIFKELNLKDLLTTPQKITNRSAETIFNTLSSGHAIILLATTKLIELVDENSLVLLDEPETHLHPPLLSTFIRYLSKLLRQRNGVAIIATHSPVILQEVPRNCAWVLSRSGKRCKAERPAIETFGENVGVITRDIFGLEIMKSGFHTLLEKYITDEYDTYDELLERFHGKLGSEAKSIARCLISDRDAE